MYESDDIIAYLAQQYGDGTVPLALNMGALTGVLCGLSLLPRGGAGSKYRPSSATAATKPIQYWGYEASPFCKLVRGTLVELELPHVAHSVARGSPKREAFLREHGTFQVPYIEDPNTGVKMFESAYIQARRTTRTTTLSTSHCVLLAARARPPSACLFFASEADQLR